MYCNKCGTKLRKNSNFCHLCGNKVSEVEIYIRKSDEPIPNQLSMGEAFEKPEFKKLEQKENSFLDILKSFRIKKDRPYTPLEGDNEFSLKYDKIENKKSVISDEEFQDVPSLEKKDSTQSKVTKDDPKIDSKKFKEFVIPDFEIKKDHIREDISVDESEIISKVDEKITTKSPSILKRFFKYMMEEEVYDSEILDRKSASKAEELESTDAQIIANDEEFLETTSTEDAILIDTSEAEELSKKTDLKSSYDFESEDEDLFDEEVKDKSPSLLEKLKSFMKEKDEDNLLDLSPDEYSDLVYGQGKIEDLKEDSIYTAKEIQTQDEEFVEFDVPEFEINNKDENSRQDSDQSITETDVSKEDSKLETQPSFFDNIVNFFKGGKVEETSQEFEDYQQESDEEEPSYTSTKSTYSYLDTEKTIRYSKTVIDSYLSKAESGELDLEDLDKIDDFSIISDDKDDDFRDSFEITPEENSAAVEFPMEEETPTITEIDEALLIEEPVIEKIDEDSYVELIVDKPIKEKEEFIYERSEETLVEEKEKTPGIFADIGDFFKSIPKFFIATSQEKNKNKEKDNIDIILNSPVTSQDTMPLVLSSEEREILNKEIDKRQRGSRQEEALNRTNVKVAPIMRKMINLGAKIIIPLFILVLALACWTISWTISNPIFIGILGVIKFSIMYITISVATNSAFNSIGLRLKRSVVSLFIFLQMVVYQILDAIYIKLTFVEGQTVEAILHVMSPKVITIVFFALLAFLLLVFNYKKIKERRGTLVFIGWYIVISTTITLVVILLELLISTILYSLFKEALFGIS